MPASDLQKLAFVNSRSSRVSARSGACPSTMNSQKVRKPRTPSTPDSRAHRSKTRRSRAQNPLGSGTSKAVSRFTSSQKPSTTDVAHMNSPVQIQWRHNKDDGSTHVSFMDPDIWNLDEVEKDYLLQVTANALNTVYAASDLDDLAVLKSQKNRHHSRSELTEMGLKAVFDRYPTPGGYVLNEFKEGEDARPSDFWLSRKQDGKSTVGSLNPDHSVYKVYDLPDLNRDPDGNLDVDLLNESFWAMQLYLEERSGDKPVDWGSQTAKVEGTASLISLIPEFDSLKFTPRDCGDLQSLEESVNAWCPNQSADQNGPN